MTRKDYILIAEALKSVDPQPTTPGDDRVCRRTYQGWSCACIAVCNALANDNPRFDRDRFLKACGVAS
jgi:hypothetical protein